MKRINRYLAMALCGGGFVFAAYAEKVRLEELPVELRDKIRAQTGGAQIEDIDRQRKNGKTVYEVGFKRDGEHTEWVFDQSGELLRGAETENLKPGKVTFEELPPAVQRVVEARLKRAKPNDIDRLVRNGEVSYEIGFKQGDQQQELLVSQSGQILRDIELSNSAVAIASAATNLNSQRVQLSNKRKVEFEQLPGPVQRTIATATKGARVEDIEIGQWRARNIYEIAFKDQGRHIELQVEDNGKIFYDPRVARNQAAGVPAGTISGAATSAYPDVTSAVTLSGSQKVEQQSLPAAVRQAIERQTAGARIEDVERGNWRSQRVYQVAFKDAQGQHVELQIDERGQIVFDPRRK